MALLARAWEDLSATTFFVLLRYHLPGRCFVRGACGDLPGFRNFKRIVWFLEELSLRETV